MRASPLGRLVQFPERRVHQREREDPVAIFHAVGAKWLRAVQHFALERDAHRLLRRIVSAPAYEQLERRALLGEAELKRVVRSSSVQRVSSLIATEQGRG